MGGKNIVGSFSYNVRDIEIIQECEKMARADGISFSEFVVACLKEQATRKKVEGYENPIGIRYIDVYGKQTDKHIQSKNLDIPRLDLWMHQIDTIDDIQKVGEVQGTHMKIALYAKNRILKLKARGGVEY